MDHNGNGLRIKIKVRNVNAATLVDYNHDDDGNKQFCSIGHLRIDDSPTTMEKGLLFQPPTPVTANRRISSSPSPPAASDVVDCSISLPSWSLTGRRGRKSIRTSCTISDELLDTKRMKIETHSDDGKSPKNKENKKKVMEKEYKCNICSKVFSSSRAMGGHKSSHYKANKTDIAITKETTTTIGTTTFKPKITMTLDSLTDQTAGRKRVIDFDLNQLPPDDDYDSHS